MIEESSDNINFSQNSEETNKKSVFKINQKALKSLSPNRQDTKISFLNKNYRLLLPISAILLFILVLIWFIFSGNGSLWDVIESILWWFALPITVFTTGFIVKKILKI